jgi:hypothetical protein
MHGDVGAGQLFGVLGLAGLARESVVDPQVLVGGEHDLVTVALEWPTVDLGGCVGRGEGDSLWLGGEVRHDEQALTGVFACEGEYVVVARPARLGPTMGVDGAG